MQGDCGHRSQHDELALGEVHDIGCVVDQGKTEPHQGIQGTDGDPGYQELEELLRHERHLFDDFPGAVMDFHQLEGVQIQPHMIFWAHVEDACSTDEA